MPMYSSPSGWNRFQPQIDISLYCHIWIYRETIRSKKVFLRISNISVPCPQAQLRGCTVIKICGHFSDLVVEIALSHLHVEFLRVKRIHQSTASERTTRLHVFHEEITVRIWLQNSLCKEVFPLEVVTRIRRRKRFRINGEIGDNHAILVDQF